MIKQNDGRRISLKMFENGFRNSTTTRAAAVAAAATGKAKATVTRTDEQRQYIERQRSNNSVHLFHMFTRSEIRTDDALSDHCWIEYIAGCVCVASDKCKQYQTSLNMNSAHTHARTLTPPQIHTNKNEQQWFFVRTICVVKDLFSIFFFLSFCTSISRNKRPTSQLDSFEIQQQGRECERTTTYARDLLNHTAALHLRDVCCLNCTFRNFTNIWMTFRKTFGKSVLCGFLR